MIATLSAFGLLLDLIGVMLMGYDLIHVQRSMRASALNNEVQLREILENTEFASDESTFVATGVSGSEGFDWDGGSDPWKIKKLFDQVNSALNTHADALNTLAEYLQKSVNDQAVAAAKTLSLTYAGLCFIATGFSLQLLAAISPILGVF